MLPGIRKLPVAILVIFTAAYGDAFAFQFSKGRSSLKINGFGNAGIIDSNSTKVDFLGDWRIRAQGNYAIAHGQTLGLVYSMDEISVDNSDFVRDAFAFWENQNYGRAEIGLTNSIAKKLGLGLPDVGGLRINDRPLFYKKIHPKGTVIPDTIIDTGYTALRINLATVPTNFVQYGLSVSGLTDDYDFAIDAGIKIRQPNGKLKTAVSLGASFMDKPEGYHTVDYIPSLTASWRAQVSGGINVQYNSWIFGTSARAIYDEHPIGRRTDGIDVGTGISYDILKCSMSLTYMFSGTGIWDSNVKNYFDNTIFASFRYKYSEYIDGWLSGGLTSNSPFISAGIRLTF